MGLFKKFAESLGLAKFAAKFELVNWMVATQIFFIFTPTWGRFLISLIFFKGVETTKQIQAVNYFIKFAQT